MYTKRLQGEIYHVIEYNRYTTWHDQPLSRQNRRFSILKKLQLRQSCKRKAEDDLTERPRKIIVTEGQSMETDGLNQRDIDNVRKAMWRQRRKHQPKLPISRMDALRAISEIETRQDVKIVTDEETQIACVYSPSAMVYLHRNQDMFGDGTFKSCPKHFEQLYISSRLQMECTSKWRFSCSLEVAKKCTKTCLSYCIPYTLKSQDHVSKGRFFI